MVCVFLDTNIVLDLFLKRENYVDNSAEIISRVYDVFIKAYISSKSILDIHYFLDGKLGIANHYTH